MSMHLNFRAELIGNADKFEEIKSILDDACHEGSAFRMEELLRNHRVSMADLPDIVEDADCNFIGLLAILLCRGKSFIESTGRYFIDGVGLDEDNLSILFHGPDDAEDFFDRLLAASDYVYDYRLFEEEGKEEVVDCSNSWNPDKPEDLDVTGELTGW